jgi:hypothetical protein
MLLRAPSRLLALLPNLLCECARSVLRIFPYFALIGVIHCADALLQTGSTCPWLSPPTQPELLEAQVRALASSVRRSC